jgi:flagellar basal-body rod protein FlgC
MIVDYLKSFAISAAGMALERTRVEVAARNLASANTVQDAGGAAYQPMRAVARVAGGAQPFTERFDEALAAATATEFAVESLAVAPRRAHEPGHPFADEQGFVSYPGVDTASEMVAMMSATRAYEANVAAFNTARTLATKTLEIGRGS